MNADRTDLSRRTFIKTTSAVVGAAGVFGAPAPARAFGANQRIRIGFIGPGGRGFGAHVQTLARLRKAGANVDLAAVSDVYSTQADKVAHFITKETGIAPKLYENYEDMLADGNIDAVTIATPDHWHAKQTLDAFKAGKHVYCEKPMTRTIEEAQAVVAAWKASGKVMQVGVQGTSSPVWNKARQLIDEGMLGKVIQLQTEYNRNSNSGQWRDYKLTRDMTPKTINWRRWLGLDYGLAPDMPFDRSVYMQWRCYWSFGSGMFTDLFVHRTSMLLKATGLRFPARVVGAGGIFFEYDNRDVPDLATLAADYNEGCQLLISSSMSTMMAPIPVAIRGHFGTFVFDNSYGLNKFDFLPERPQITGDGSLKPHSISVGKVENVDDVHFKNYVDAIEAGDPAMVNNDPELGAAAVTTVNLAVRSYREGKVLFYNDGKVSDTNANWPGMWEKMSKDRVKPRHVPGWKAGDKGSLLKPPEYMNLAGPWINGKDPAPPA